MAATVKKQKVSQPAPARVVIDGIKPDLSQGRFNARDCLNQPFKVEAIILCDGHESLKADLLYRHESAQDWIRRPLQAAGNDVYQADLVPDRLGLWYYTVEAAQDHFETWRDGFLKKLSAGEASALDIRSGIMILQNLRDNSDVAGAMAALEKIGKEKLSAESEDRLRVVLSDEKLRAVLRAYWPDEYTVRYDGELPLRVDPPLAGCSSWYEFFPRSRWTGIAEHGTLADAIDRLPYIVEMGFDIIYLPPLHPVGKKQRKGRNNALTAAQGDPGSPWAIGSHAGGHKSIDPALGTFDDFKNLVDNARAQNLAIALDIAFQCAPDHPYVTEHPEWFRKRPDGSIQYAENPPKKYQDIYPFDFETTAWQSLWAELKSIFIFWAEKGVRVFRVDNPHTKAFAFWEWVIREVRRDYPETIFLAEAFTRPHVMAYLAKIGFSQSYTYFAWRSSKQELTAYLKELTGTELKYYFRPNFWPNTPDILPHDLQGAGRPVYAQRFILAATLSANYGIYGPAFELMESQPIAPGKEEYLNSEKYEKKQWDIKRPDSLAPLIGRVNRIRRENSALQAMGDLAFHPVSNDQLIAYTRRDGDNLILVVVNLDTAHRQEGIVDLQIHTLGIDPQETYHLHDLLNDARYDWTGWRNYVALDPQVTPAHIFRISTKQDQYAAV